MSTCTVAGPCQPMASAISRGVVHLLDGKPVLNSGPRLRDCCWCGERLSGGLLTAWPWTLLRQAGQAHEATEAL